MVPDIKNQFNYMSTALAIFWPHEEHWSVKIPLKTGHYRMPAMEEKGFVVLKDLDIDFPESEWKNLVYMDWKSGGDTNFAPLASCDGTIECKGFWENGKTDKHAIFTPNADLAPTLTKYIKSIPANFGRVRVIRLEPQGRDQAIRSVHRDDNNRLNPEDEGWVVRMWIELTDNPDSYMLLYDSDEKGLPIKESESRVSMQRGSHFVVDSQRLWHVGVHNGDKPRYAAIISVESSPEMEAWIQSKK
jgi:hypothetical protein